MYQAPPLGSKQDALGTLGTLGASTTSHSHYFLSPTDATGSTALRRHAGKVCVCEWEGRPAEGFAMRSSPCSQYVMPIPCIPGPATSGASLSYRDMVYFQKGHSQFFLSSYRGILLSVLEIKQVKRYYSQWMQYP